MLASHSLVFGRLLHVTAALNGHKVIWTEAQQAQLLYSLVTGIKARALQSLKGYLESNRYYQKTV